MTMTRGIFERESVSSRFLEVNAISYAYYLNLGICIANTALLRKSSSKNIHMFSSRIIEITARVNVLYTLKAIELIIFMNESLFPRQNGSRA